MPSDSETDGNCANCGRRLRYSGRGRPRVRCTKCQTQHRRDYLRDAKRRERGG